MDHRRELERGVRLCAEGKKQPIQPLPDELPAGIDVSTDIDERSTVARQPEAGVERGDHVEGLQKLADGVGGPAVVVIERGAPEHVVAGDQ